MESCPTQVTLLLSRLHWLQGAPRRRQTRYGGTGTAPLALLPHIASRFSQGDTALISASYARPCRGRPHPPGCGCRCECQGAGESAPRIPCSTVAAGGREGRAVGAEAEWTSRVVRILSNACLGLSDISMQCSPCSTPTLPGLLPAVWLDPSSHGGYGGPPARPAGPAPGPTRQRGREDKVRTQGRGVGAVAAGAGGYPSAPFLCPAGWPHPSGRGQDMWAMQRPCRHWRSMRCSPPSSSSSPPHPSSRTVRGSRGRRCHMSVGFLRRRPHAREAAIERRCISALDRPVLFFPLHPASGSGSALHSLAFPRCAASLTGKCVRMCP